MNKINKQFAKCAGVALLTGLTLTGCGTMGLAGGNGFNPTPRQAREMGQATCTVAGAAAGAALTRSSDNVTRAIGTALGGYSGRQLCGAAAEAAADSRGHCRQRVVYRGDGSRVVTATCDRNTAYPGSVAPPR